MISYLGRLVSWLWQGVHLNVGLLIAIAPPVVVALLWPGELGFRIVGFALQIAGIWVVWIGIRGAREQFDEPGWWAQTKSWLSSFPRHRGRIVTASMNLTAAVSVVAGRAYGWHGAGANASLEKRVELIEKNLENMRTELSAFQKDSDDRSRTHADEIKRERAEREAADQAIYDEIKETETGGLKLNAAGVWWLFSGTVCSTFPGELADLVSRLTA